MSLPIVYVDKGVANRFKDRIEINRELLKHPKLHDIILQHELGHTDEDFSFEDLIHDLKAIRHWNKIMNFVLDTPSAQRDLKPVYVEDGVRYIDYNLILAYSLGFLLTVGVMMFMFFW